MIRAADFFIAPLTTALAADEIIVEIRLPAWPATRRWGFQEFSRRRGDFAMAAAAVFYDRGRDGRARNAHVGAIGVGDRPLRLAAAEAEIDGHVVDDARSPSAPAPRRPPPSIRRAIFMPAAPIGASLLGTMVERALQERFDERRCVSAGTDQVEWQCRHASRSTESRSSVEVEPRMTLADCLRHVLRLTGTHVGCEHGVCGACTVLVDGAAVRACLILAVQAEGSAW